MNFHAFITPFLSQVNFSAFIGFTTFLGLFRAVLTGCSSTVNGLLEHCERRLKLFKTILNALFFLLQLVFEYETLVFCRARRAVAPKKVISFQGGRKSLFSARRLSMLDTKLTFHSKRLAGKKQISCWAKEISCLPRTR